MKCVVKKVISVAFFATLLLLSMIIPTFAYETSCKIDFSKSNFSCLAQKPTDDNSTVITSEVSVNPSFSYHGRVFTQYTMPWEYSTVYDKVLVFPLNGFSLYTDTDYKFVMQFFQSYNVDTTVFVQAYFIDANGNSTHFELINETGRYYSSSHEFTGVFHTPSVSGAYTVNLLVMVSSGGGVSTVRQSFYFGDTSFEIDSPLYGDHYENDTSQIDDLNNQIIAIEGALPSMDDVDFDDLLNGADLSAYLKGFEAVNLSFAQIINAFEIGPVILFCLALGLCSYLLGRRMSA